MHRLLYTSLIIILFYPSHLHSQISHWRDYGDIVSLPGQAISVTAIESDARRNYIWVGIGRSGMDSQIPADLLGIIYRDRWGVWSAVPNLPGRNTMANVQDISIAPDGRVWAATYDSGLLLFDGTAWAAFDSENSALPTDRLLKVTADDNDYLWMINGDNEILRWSDANSILTLKFSELDPGISPDVDNINALHADGSGSIWVGGTFGIAEISSELAPVSLIRSGSDNSFGTVHSLYKDANSDIWVGTSEGLYKLNRSARRLEHIPDVPSDEVRTITGTPAGALWIGTESHGVIRFTGEFWIPYNEKTLSFHFPGIGFAAIDNFGRVYAAGYPARMFIYDPVLHISYGEFADISAVNTERGVELAWEVFNESEVYGYEVLAWDIEAGIYNRIGYIESTWGNETLKKYSFTDYQATGNMEYRIGLRTLFPVSLRTGPLFITTTVPSGITLLQNYPNPFNPSTRIIYTVDTAERITLSVYNMLGQRIAMIVDEYQEPGRYSISFDADPYSAGVYFYTLRVGIQQQTMRMLLVK